MICKICEKECNESITFLCQKCYSLTKQKLEDQKLIFKRSTQHDVILEMRRYIYIFKTILEDKRR